MSPPSSPVRSKELVECSGLCQCPVWLGLGGGLRGNSGILPAMPSFSVRTSKPVENFYKNLSQIEDPSGSKIWTVWDEMLPRNDSLQLLFCIQNKCVCVGEHKEDYAKVGESKVRVKLRGDYDYVLSWGWPCFRRKGPKGGISEALTCPHKNNVQGWLRQREAFY